MHYEIEWPVQKEIYSSNDGIYSMPLDVVAMNPHTSQQIHTSNVYLMLYYIEILNENCVYAQM